MEGSVDAYVLAKKNQQVFTREMEMQKRRETFDGVSVAKQADVKSHKLQFFEWPLEACSKSNLSS